MRPRRARNKLRKRLQFMRNALALAAAVAYASAMSRCDVPEPSLVATQAAQSVCAPGSIATGENFVRAAGHGRIKDVVNAISAGQDVDYLTHPKNDSALMAAAYFGRVEVVKVLLAAGADASIMDVHQADALHHAIVGPRWLGHNASGHAAATIARLLIASGCNMTS